MRRLVILLLLGLGSLCARDAEAQTAMSLHWTAGGGVAAFVDLDRQHEATGVGQHRGETATAGLAWQAGGFRAAVSAGRYAYDYTGAGAGTGRLASFSVRHDIVHSSGGGTLSLELQQSRLWESGAQRDITSARLGWSLRF